MYKKYLSMDPFSFDQSDSGWREIDRQGYYASAAVLIDQYIEQHAEQIIGQDKVSIQTMYFHAGQEYAMVGEAHYEQAVERFKRSYKHKQAWDTYVDGTIAFLTRDDEALEQCADKLAMLAKADPRELANALLLRSFIEGSASHRSYADIYGH